MPGRRLYRAEDVRMLDRLAIEHQAVSGYELMCAAGEAAWSQLIVHWPDVEMVFVFCGAGNNAGDGYVLARLAMAQGVQVRLVQLCDGTDLKGDALAAFNAYSAAGGISKSYQHESDIIVDWENTVMVDALLGTGLQRPLAGRWQQVVQVINKYKTDVMALDIPSGLNADNGCEMGEAIKANITVTFIGRKQGMYTADGPDCCGKIICESLGIRESVYKLLANDLPRVELLNPDLLKQLGPRQHNSHKGSNGHVLIVGGIAGFSGAVSLAAMAAMRCGAGLVSVATDPVHAALLDSQIPEIMCHAVKDAARLKKLMASANVIVIGPGLGQQAWSKQMLKTVIHCEQSLVLDADALNLMSSDVSCKINTDQRNRIMTPHPGEAAVLLSCRSEQIQHNRFASVKKLAELYQATIVLKGAGSLVVPLEGQATSTWVCDAGNPGMATAGMGDLLSGTIAALLAQGLSTVESTKTGVLLHAMAGDLAVQQGQRGTIASDLLIYLRNLVNSR